MSTAPRWGKARTPTTREGPSNAWTRKPGPPPPCIPLATATSYRRPMTWCSMRRAASISRTSARVRASPRPWGGLLRLAGWLEDCGAGISAVEPNGCGLSPDGTTLYVADTEGARLWAFAIEARGVLRAPAHSTRTAAACRGAAGERPLRQFGGAGERQHRRGDPHHRLYYGVLARGRSVRAVKMPDVYPTNICFGGADMRTAYITLSDSGRLGMMQWPEPGLKLNFG